MRGVARSSEWSITRLVPGGDGFARLDDGRVGFATGALPGDRIRPRAVVEHRSYVRATDWELVRASPRRVEPACPVADACGGCDWMRLERSAQLAAKAAIAREALARTGGFHDLPDELPIVSAGPDLGYRSRLRLHVADDRVGLYARGSHELVEVPGCPVSSPAVERALAELRAAVSRHPGALSAFSEVQIRAAPDAPASLCFFPRRGARTDAPDVAAFVAELEPLFWVWMAGRRGKGAPLEKWPSLDGVTLLVPPESFTQVDWAVNLELVRRVVDGARARGAERFCDLYSGAGNFSLPLLAAGLTGKSIERDARAVDAARRAARDAGLSDSGFVAGDASELARLAAGERFDLCLVDPPRRGARDVLPLLSALRAPSIAICSCDPVTLARDLRALAREGYALEEVTVFDMFPQTHHAEVLVWLRS